MVVKQFSKECEFECDEPDSSELNLHVVNAFFIWSSTVSFDFAEGEKRDEDGDGAELTRWTGDGCKDGGGCDDLPEEDDSVGDADGESPRLVRRGRFNEEDDKVVTG